MTPDLRTRYLGLTLKSPLVASASPLSGRLDTLQALEAAGAAAVVMQSLFEEQIEREESELNDLIEEGTWSQPEASSYFPDFDGYNTGPGSYLRHLESVRNTLSIPVIGSLNGASPGGWVRYARNMQDAGAHAVELNANFVPSSTALKGSEVEDRYVELVAAVRDAISIPMAVKIGPYFSSLPDMAMRLVESGADGLVLFNRFLEPDIDLETLRVKPLLRLSTSEEVRLPLRWIAILSGRVHCSLAATSGVHTADDALKLLLAGADVVMMASALLIGGPNRLVDLRERMLEWLTEREYTGVEQLKGSVSQRSIADPSEYERANYIRALTGYTASAPEGR